MFARETAEPGAACSEGTGSCGVLEAGEVVWGAENRGDTLTSIAAVPGGGVGSGGGTGDHLEAQINHLECLIFLLLILENIPPTAAAAVSPVMAAARSGNEESLSLAGLYILADLYT